MPKPKPRIVSIVETSSGKVVETMDASNLSERNFDRFWSGLCRKVNFDRFHLVDSADEDG